MEAEMILEHLHDETIERPTGSHERLEHLGALRLGLQTRFDCVELTLDSADSVQQLFLVVARVTHGFPIP